MKLEVKVTQNGEEEKLELVAAFQINEDNIINDYILLTKNEIVEEKLIIVLTAKIDGDKLYKIDGESSWNAFKDFMKFFKESSNINFIDVSLDKTLTIEDRLKNLAITKEKLDTFKNMYQDYLSNLKSDNQEDNNAEDNNKIVIPILENQGDETIEEEIEKIEDNDVNDIEESVDQEEDVDDSEVIESKDEIEDDLDEPIVEEAKVDEVEDDEEEIVDESTDNLETVVEENTSIIQNDKQEENTERLTLNTEIENAIDKFIKNI